MGDWIIIAAAIAIAVGSLLWIFLSVPGSTVTIRQNNEIVYCGALTVNAEIPLEHNTAVVCDGKVYMKDADCANQICVHHPAIQKSGETIVCLPNRVVIEVE